MWNFLVYLDRLINDKWLKGYFESISGRCHRTPCWFCNWLCKHLNIIDKDHCKKSYINDRINNPDLPI
jgi:hypothetical protein